MTELQAKEYKLELEKATEELNKFKKRYGDDLKVEQKKTVLAAAAGKEVTQPQTGSQVKFVGGGFRMSIDNQNK